MEEQIKEQLNHIGEPSNEMTYELKEPSDVTFEIRNPSGRIVRTLSVGHKEPGTITLRWDGKNDNGSPVASGIYYAVIKMGDKTVTRKLAVIR